MAKKKKSKIKKFLKGAAKAALIGGALYAGTKALGKRRKSVSEVGVPEDVNINVNPLKKFITKKTIDRTTPKYDEIFGGGVGFKKGGRTGKQFGGGLGSTARRDMR